MKGAPTREELSLMNPQYKQTSQMPDFKARPLASFLEPGCPAEVVDLIERLLEYVPSKRITA